MVFESTTENETSIKRTPLFNPSYESYPTNYDQIKNHPHTSLPTPTEKNTHGKIDDTLCITHDSTDTTHNSLNLFPTSSNFLKLHRNQDVISLVKNNKRYEPYKTRSNKTPSRNFPTNILKNSNCRNIRVNYGPATVCSFTNAFPNECEENKGDELLHQLENLNIISSNKLRVRFSDPK